MRRSTRPRGPQPLDVRRCDGRLEDRVLPAVTSVVLPTGGSAIAGWAPVAGTDWVFGVSDARAAAESPLDRALRQLAWAALVLGVGVGVLAWRFAGCGRLAGPVLYASSSLRAEPGVLAKNRRGQSGLWGYSISGDLPIVLLQVGDAANIELVRQLVPAAWWSWPPSPAGRT